MIGRPTISQRPKPHPAIDTAFLHNQAVLFDDRTGQVHELSPSASAVWLLVDGELSLDDVAAALHELVNVPFETLRADAETAVEDFAARGLLEGTEAVRRDGGHHHQPASTVSAHAGPVVLPRPPDP